MKTIVMGGGVIGVAAAYYLARDGHEVTVIERQSSAGCETTYANAGLIAPGHATTWASPQAPMMLLKSLVGADTALRLKFRLDPRLYLWGLYFLRNCTSARQRANTLPKLKLCLYSQEATAALMAETGIACDWVSKGILYLYRHQEQLETGIENMRFLNENGHVQEVIDVAECVRIEPALEPVKERFAGAIYGPNDASGDAHLFTQALAQHCAERLGVSFLYDTTVKGLDTAGDHVEGVVTENGTVRGDVYVMSLGPYVSGALRGTGLHVPIYPVKGYSLTFPIDGHNGAPTVGGIDEQNLTAWARMGDRLRVTATAEFSGYDTDHKPSDFEGMLGVVRELFPDGANYEKPSYWACLRPMTPDGPPMFGKIRHDNLYFNAGQGHMGWTMACGSGRVVTDLIAGRQPEIEIAGMTADKY